MFSKLQGCHSLTVRNRKFLWTSGGAFLVSGFPGLTALTNLSKAATIWLCSSSNSCGWCRRQKCQLFVHQEKVGKYLWSTCKISLIERIQLQLYVIPAKTHKKLMLLEGGNFSKETGSIHHRAFWVPVAPVEDRTDAFGAWRIPARKRWDKVTGRQWDFLQTNHSLEIEIIETYNSKFFQPHPSTCSFSKFARS